MYQNMHMYPTDLWKQIYLGLGRSRTGSGKRWTSEFIKDDACLDEENCPISTSLSIIPLLNKSDCV